MQPCASLPQLLRTSSRQATNSPRSALTSYQSESDLSDCSHQSEPCCFPTVFVKQVRFSQNLDMPLNGPSSIIERPVDDSKQQKKNAYSLHPKTASTLKRQQTADVTDMVSFSQNHTLIQRVLDSYDRTQFSLDKQKQQLYHQKQIAQKIKNDHILNKLKFKGDRAIKTWTEVNGQKLQ
ncbi:Hypothetical_protein [Hexamita inflata]|uniref:Hypothetical_protein n=1 Tax=Hexamita inflata TaxID=28002 RepID=A0ABP1KAX2_9EUKA